jgi:hypothetical protein
LPVPGGPNKISDVILSFSIVAETKCLSHLRGIKNDWDGKTMFGITVGGRELPTDTYFYILNLKDGGGNYRGYIYLAR